MSTITDLRMYREKLDEEVRPIVRVIQARLAERGGAKQEDMDAATCLGVALENWEKVDAEITI